MGMPELRLMNTRKENDMTFELLSNIIEEHNIPKNVHLLSDSGWECSETEMDGVFYNRNENKLVITQDGSLYDRAWFRKDGWELLHGANKLCATCKHINKWGDCLVRKDHSNDGFDIAFSVGIHDTNNCEVYEKGTQNDN